MPRLHGFLSLRAVRAAARSGWWHPCAIPECRTEIGRRKTVCRPHKRALPTELRARLWWSFNPGQTVQSEAFRDAARDAHTYLTTNGKA